MNGTGVLRQFVPKVARHNSRAAFGYWPSPVCYFYGAYPVELTEKSSTDARPNGADSTSEILQTRRPHVIVHRRLALAVKAKLFERFAALTPLAVGAR
jgi:hypothetical protein